MCVLTAHEAIPGHHLSGNGDGDFGIDPTWVHTTPSSKDGLFTAESLPKFCDKRGRSNLNYAACRLVADTGLHAFGWSLEKTRLYLQRNEPGISDEVAQKEALRYLCDPGQALSYYIGAKTFHALRKANVGAVQTFHADILRRGPVPLWWLVQRKHG